MAVGTWADRALGGLRTMTRLPRPRSRVILGSSLRMMARPVKRVFFMAQSETHADHSLEERSLHLFKSERSEDLVAIGLAALLVLAVLLGLRV